MRDLAIRCSSTLACIVVLVIPAGTGILLKSMLVAWTTILFATGWCMARLLGKRH